jgi:hypothetical protein
MISLRISSLQFQDLIVDRAKKRLYTKKGIQARKNTQNRYKAKLKGNKA